jgi:NADH-quinone oxidoreductase subunit A
VKEKIPVSAISSFQFAGGDDVEKYANQYVIVTVFLVLGILFPIAVLQIGKLLRPSKPNEEKETTYESGNEPVGDSQIRFNVRYYLYALMFVVFDVETVFLYPWAVAYKQLGLFALFEMVVFVGLLLIGLIYAWRKKVFQWNSI